MLGVVGDAPVSSWRGTVRRALRACRNATPSEDDIEEAVGRGDLSALSSRLRTFKGLAAANLARPLRVVCSSYVADPPTREGMVRALLEARADPSVGLREAVQAECVDAAELPLVRLMLEYKATALSATESLEHASARTFRLLVAAGADVNRCDQAGLPLLLRWLAKRDATTLRMALELKADPNARGPTGETALLLAAASHADAVPLLLRARACPNARSATGETPLHRAARSNQLAPAQVLLASGAEPLLEDHDGNAFFHGGLSHKWSEVLCGLGDRLHLCLQSRTQLPPPLVDIVLSFVAPGREPWDAGCVLLGRNQ